MCGPPGNPLDQILDSLPDAIVLLDGRGDVVAASQYAEALLGYERGGLNGKAAATLASPPPGPGSEAATPWLLLSGRQRLWAIRRDGSTLPIDVTSGPVFGQPGSFIVLMRDASDRHRLEERVRQDQQLEWLGRLAGGFAHDFNNLLAVILGQCELLLRSVTPDHSQHRRVDQVRSAGERALELSRQLLAFSRGRPSDTRDIDLNETIEGLRNVLRWLLGSEVEVTLHLGSGLSRVAMRPAEVEGVLLHLAANARDSMPHGGQLVISTSSTSPVDPPAVATQGVSQVCLTVTDSGEGMPPEVQERIFEPLFTTRKSRGVGLGLSFVHDIVRRSGGFVRFRSEPGGGTSFSVFLPAVGAVEDQRRKGAVRPTVLLVEDEPSLRELIRETLIANGCDVLGAPDAEGALEVAASHRGEIDLLLTDVFLPGRSGPELAEKLRGARPELRVIFMSGYPADALPEPNSLGPGALLVTKPFTQDAFTAKLREALGSKLPGEA